MVAWASLSAVSLWKAMVGVHAEQASVSLKLVAEILSRMGGVRLDSFKVLPSRALERSQEKLDHTSKDLRTSLTPHVPSHYLGDHPFGHSGPWGDPEVTLNTSPMLHLPFVPA